MTLVEIFKQLKEARLAANRTLRDVSKACGVAEPTLSMAERGERVGMRGHNLVNWAAALDFELVLREVSTSPETGPAWDACRDMPVSTTPGECPAHGFHPHNGMTCLDCPGCRPPAESTEDGAA